MNIKRDRLDWLDVAKGLTIILMVLGHTSIPDVASRFIFAFHMPLFFIASGWTTNWQKKGGGRFVFRKCRTILLPFLIYSIIVLLLWKFTIGYDIVGWFGHGWGGYALWFIPVLFLASVLGRIVWLSNNRYIRLGIMVVLLGVGMLLSNYDLYLPWSLSSVPYACFLILLGTELKSYMSRFIDKPTWWLIMCLFVITLAVSYFWKLDMAWNNILPIVPLTVAAITGTFMVFIFSAFIVKHFKKSTLLLKTIGQETFAIVAFSQIIIMIQNEYFSLNPLIKYSSFASS